jgi:transposase
VIRFRRGGFAMPKPYSLDLRERVVGFVENGHSRPAAAHFRVSVSFVVSLIKAVRTRGSFEPKPSVGRRRAKLKPHRLFLLAQVVEKADITVPELGRGVKAAIDCSGRCLHGQRLCEPAGRVCITATAPNGTWMARVVARYGLPEYGLRSAAHQTHGRAPYRPFPDRRRSARLRQVLAAVGRDRRAGDEASVVGCKEHHAARHFLWLAEAAHRNLGDN